MKEDDQAKHSVLTIVERATGYLQIGKLERHCAAETTECCVELIRRRPDAYLTITADNGTEFHNYRDIEAATCVEFYFATPYHSWERGTNENTNGLIRQYFPKGADLSRCGEKELALFAATLNSRPRKAIG